MKKLLIAILLSGGLFLGASLLDNNLTQPVFAADDVGENEGGGDESTSIEDVKLNFGQVAKDNEVIGTTDYDPEDGAAGFGALMGQILRIVVTVAGLILFIYLLWGGLGWITAGGDKSKVEAARNRITQSIIGMIVLAGTIAIFAIMQSALNFEIFTFTGGTRYSGGGSGGNSGSGNGGNSSCVITGDQLNAGKISSYCSQGEVLVKCVAPDEHLNYNHNDPCDCVDGEEYQQPNVDFDSC